VPTMNMIEIEEAIRDLPVLYKIDIVDFKTVDERFYKIASKYKEYTN